HLAARADDADVEPGEDVRIRLQRQHLLRGLEQHAAPVRAVVAPGIAHDVAARDAESAGDQRHVVLWQRAALAQRRRREREALALPAQLDEADAALLHDELAAGPAARLQPRMAAAQRRMPGERQFAP